MSSPFPLTPIPSYYGDAQWGSSTDKFHGIHYPGDSVQIRLNKATGATSYTVVWWNAPNGTFDTVSSGTLTGTETSFNVAFPSSGWPLGWFRIYGYGPTNDSTYGNACFVTNFCFIRNNPNFITAPAGNVTWQSPMGVDGIDLAVKGVLGIGTSRLQIDNTNAPTTGTNNISSVQGIITNYATPYWTSPGSSYLDPVRTRHLWCAFPNRTVDHLDISPASGGNIYLHVYVKTASQDGSKVFISSGAGTTGGTYKVQVYYPDSSTLVETWDNLSSSASTAAATINAGSSYVFVAQGGGVGAATTSPTAIGNTYLAGVTQVVSALYPYGVTRFEGPSNEPTIGAGPAHALYLFQEAVHAGNASAKAMGPCAVSLDDSNTSDSWSQFVAQCQADGFTPDIISSHAYNDIVQGDINCGRANLSSWLSRIAPLGVTELWQTESQWVLTSVYGVHHPRRAAREIIMRLLFEEYGIPREQNNPWYDTSHGFWGIPAFFENADLSLQPIAALYRVLAEETWGMTYQSAYSLPSSATKMMLAQRYSGSSGDCAVFQLDSWIPGATVTLNVSGASSLTVSDGFGNLSTIAVSGGVAVVPLSDCPTYVRLPSGVSITVATVNGWNPAEAVLPAPASCTLGGSSTSVPIDGSWLNNYANGGSSWVSAYPSGGGMVSSSHGLPDTAVFNFTTTQNISRVLIWCGPVWQKASTMLTFTIDMSSDGGSTWATKYSFDDSASCTSFLFGSDSSNTGTQRETTWHEQWIFDCPLGLPISCNAVRISCSAASYGGEPDSASVTTGGQGYATPQIVLQEVQFRGFPLGYSGYTKNVKRGHTPIGHTTW